MKEGLEELCTVVIGKKGLEDSYTFYKNGMIRHCYDKNIFNYGLMEWVQPGEINNIIKRRIIKNCRNKYKRNIRRILDFNLRMN